MAVENDCGWTSPLCLVENVKNSKQMMLVTATLEQLRLITEPLVIVSVIGMPQTGKSLLSNRLAGKKEGKFSKSFAFFKSN